MPALIIKRKMLARN